VAELLCSVFRGLIRVPVILSVLRVCPAVLAAVFLGVISDSDLSTEAALVVDRSPLLLASATASVLLEVRALPAIISLLVLLAGRVPARVPPVEVAPIRRLVTIDRRLPYMGSSRTA